MKHTLVLLLSACCLSLAAEHTYPTNTDPAHAEFFGKLGRDNLVITNAPVNGEARVLPKYLHAVAFADSYPAEAAWYYRTFGASASARCSSVRDGNAYSRNYDWPFTDAAEFVIEMAAGPNRFASVGVASVGTNLTEQIVSSRVPSPFFKCLPGATLDGINENGVVCNINVASGEVAGWHGSSLHPLAAPRWVLDNATNAEHAATYLADNIGFPDGWSMNFHFMVADETSTYIVENGEAHEVTGRAVMTNFKLYPTRDTSGEGQERFDLLAAGANITNAWYSLAYLRSTSPVRVSDIGPDTNAVFSAWESKTREAHRGEVLPSGKVWWQSVHSSVYDISGRTLRIAVQEVDDWYVFSVPVSGGVKVETDPTVPAWAKQSNPPEGMPTTGLVWNATAGSIETANGAKTIGAVDVGAYGKSNSFQINDGNGISVGPDLTSVNGPYAMLEGNALTFYDGFGGSTRFDSYGYIWSSSGGMWQFPIGISGTVMVESWQSLSRAFDATSTNATACASVGAKMMTLIDQPVTTKINQSVSSRLNTYVDGETGVEYEGKWYGGSMYFVPTGNVYPPNN